MQSFDTVYFSTTVGTARTLVPFPVSPTLQFLEIIPEVAKKFNIKEENLAIASIGGNTLTETDYMGTIEDVIRKFGNQFELINRGVVGSDETQNEKWQEGIYDHIIPKFPDQISEIGPKHRLWAKRIELEVAAILRYINFLKRNGSRSWFQIQPMKENEFNFMVWKGYLTVPDRPEISFDIRILLNPEYPKVPPRCVADIDIANYCGKVYTQNQWHDPEDGKTYIMICHDHLSEQHAWSSNLGIAHFFVRQIWYWWGAQQNFIIKEFDKKWNS